MRRMKNRHFYFLILLIQISAVRLIYFLILLIQISAVRLILRKTLTKSFEFDCIFPQNKVPFLLSFYIMLMMSL